MMINIIIGIWILGCIVYGVLPILDKRLQKKFAREKNIGEGLEKCLRLVKEINGTPWTEVDILTRPRSARKKLTPSKAPTMKDIAAAGGGVRIRGDDVTILTPEEGVGNHFDLRVMDDKIGNSHIDDIGAYYLKHLKDDVMQDVKWIKEEEIHNIEDIEEVDDGV